MKLQEFEHWLLKESLRDPNLSNIEEFNMLLQDIASDDKDYEKLGYEYIHICLDELKKSYNALKIAVAIVFSNKYDDDLKLPYAGDEIINFVHLATETSWCTNDLTNEKNDRLCEIIAVLISLLSGEIKAITV